MNAIAVSGNNVYVGGTFTNSGAVAANYIAKWDGSTWSALTTGVSGGATPGVNAIAINGTDVYVGGGFTTAGSGPAMRIAKWNGITWSAVGTGDSPAARTIWFGQSPSTPATSMSAAISEPPAAAAPRTSPSGMARHGRPSARAPGLPGNMVRAITINGSDVVVGGDFTTAGGIGANRMARWDGSTWWAFGTGADNTVLALAARERRLCWWKFHNSRWHHRTQRRAVERQQLVRARQWRGQ